MPDRNGTTTDKEHAEYGKECVKGAATLLARAIRDSGEPHTPQQPNLARLRLEQIADLVADAGYSFGQILGEVPR